MRSSSPRRQPQDRPRTAIPSGDAASSALDSLLTLLDLEVIEVNIFRGLSPKAPHLRVFGGQVAAQALVAAGRTVETGVVHSLHAYFLRPGDPNKPILYEVDRIRDGRSFTTRRVVAIQHGQVIFNLAASFHLEEQGLEHQVPAPEAPDPSELPGLHELLAPLAGEGDSGRHHPFDVRHIEPGPRQLRRDRSDLPPLQRIWFRTAGPLPDDFLVHACVVAYASDLWLLDTAVIPHPINFDDPAFMAASLDHAMWFHRTFRADEWLLYDQDSPIAHGGRALVRGRIFTADGQLVVSVVQEGLTRILTRRRSADGDARARPTSRGTRPG